MRNFFKIQIEKGLAIIILIGLCLTVLLIFVLFYLSLKLPIPPEIPLPVKSEKIKKFSSEEEFKDYLQKAKALRSTYGTSGFGMREISMLKTEEAPMPSLEIEAPERVSETTVQVAGIDEPDILKTDGKEIYFSSEPIYGIEASFNEEGVRRMSQEEFKTNLIKAFPPVDLKIESEIDKTGELLLDNNILIIFSGQEIYGYDVSKPESPEKKWEVKLEDNNNLVEARLYKNKIYLVTKSWIDQSRPCPIVPLKINEKSLDISCQEIYHPLPLISIDATFVTMVLDPGSGEIEGKVSFVGSSDSSIVYMSEKAIYLTYFYQEDLITFFSNFFKENQETFSNQLNEKLEKLENYEISSQAKLLEFQVIFENYLNSLDADQRLKIENELTNKISDYYSEHKRELEKTGIVKIKLEGFSLAANGSVPGYPLNQFSLDEYKDDLRIATTIGERMNFGFIFPTERGSVNDIYILDENLKITGSIKDLGLKERIYSARFIEDKGYLVTFRQTDPFYVLDLSDPQNPQLKGELKIPGYSSYLHPIDKDKILGIGKEDQQVKISLFDVSLPENPKETDKYLLDEFWSDVLETHHAFLLDKKHNIFFLPGSKGGYIFSYKNDKIELIKTISQISAKRALYINDYLYIVGDDKITVLNEIDWEKIKELEF